MTAFDYDVDRFDQPCKLGYRDIYQTSCEILAMTLSELIPSIQALPRAEKLHLIQLLAADVACNEAIAGDIADKAIPIWSPYDSYEGAATLLRVLNEDKVAS